ncbi:tRNA 4-thiouridine(8) synthase ThiI [Candidatus Atribacteria bacterium HGW-Atribacteria-1]|nr:MAG: tRNA 4-thiouridine(8) synthase ThiI [Candidatus Atribacteria bacterium HGW-Atribacteria-1]
MKYKIKAVVLFSGGLDSILALKLIQEQGIEVKGVNFKTPFFGLDEAFVIAKDLDIDLKIIDITEELLKILKKPKYGFGKNMNPCIDCHALMFKKAGEYMNKIGASFILSGEVLGERPMSQNRNSLSIIERESGFEGKILRPLSALLLTETIPEKGGLVNRNKLLDISGRSRKRQIELAAKMGINDYPSPAGGCKLTEPAFSKRLRDLFTQGSFSLEEIELLKLGRHFRLSKDIKLVVGRNKEENEQLQNFFQDGDFLFKAKNLKGPVSLLKRGSRVNNEPIDKSCQITARYCDRNEEENEEVNINYYSKSKELVRTMKVKPLREEELEILRIQG